MSKPTAQDTKQDTKMTPDGRPLVPSKFPDGQLFIAVSENDGPSAGFDGGPEKGGRGSWPRGTVAPWEAVSTVPIAVRDPKDGLITKGYLEPVISQEFNAAGKTIVTSEHYYGVYDTTLGAYVLAAPSPRAVQRASIGAVPVSRALQSIGQQTSQRRAESAGLVVR